MGPFYISSITYQCSRNLGFDVDSRVIGYADTLPAATLNLHHQRRHSQASIIYGLRALLSGVKVRLATLKTRSL
jgi:hypothetical protein